MKGLLQRIFGGRTKPLTDDEAKQLARHDDPSVRTELASRADLRPELLYFLAEDQSPAVRAKVATNETTPAQANLLLAKDIDDQVRADLAGKIARLAPGLSANDQDKVRRLTYETLAMLAQDQIPKVRQILAETLKDVAHAPPEVINRLARDADLAVASPILCYSPVLTDQDLLDIINASPIPGALAAISRRSNVSMHVTDAIASSDDTDAIAVLLGNKSAQIREETLDRLVDRAVDIESWHQPLVMRPHLSSKSCQKLARFVAAHLLQALSERQDLDPQSAQAVAAIVQKRLDEMDASGLARSGARSETDAAIAMERARQLMGGGQLDESAVDTALSGGDHALVVAALSLLSGLSVEVVSKTIVNQSAKGMVAIVWKAGLSMTLAVELQTKILHLPPTRVLRSGVGGFPLSPSEMSWQLEFLGGE